MKRTGLIVAAGVVLAACASMLQPADVKSLRGADASAPDQAAGTSMGSGASMGGATDAQPHRASITQPARTGVPATREVVRGTLVRRARVHMDSMLRAAAGEVCAVAYLARPGYRCKKTSDGEHSPGLAGDIPCAISHSKRMPRT